MPTPDEPNHEDVFKALLALYANACKNNTAQIEGLKKEVIKDYLSSYNEGWEACKDLLIVPREKQAVKEAMEKLLKVGHGGGSWRRIIMQMRDA